MITSSIVPAQERFRFYPSITANYQYLEQAVYHFSDRFITDYSGGYWEFVTLDNGGKFAYPEMGESVAVNNAYNRTSASLSKEAAGICIWLITLSNCAISAYHHGNSAELESLSEHHVLLMDYAREHAEWESIALVID